MAELNFGLLNPPGSQSIGNAFVTGMDQGQEARARDLQMQQSVRQSEVTQMQLQKLKQDAAGLAEFSRKVSAMGGPSDPVEIAKAYLAHPNIEMQKLGAGLMQKAQTVAAYEKANPPGVNALSTTPAMAPSAGAPMGAAAASGVAPANALAATAPATPPSANALAAPTAATPMTAERRIAQIQAELRQLAPYIGPNGAPNAIQRSALLTKEQDELMKPHTVAPGGTLVRTGLPDFNAPAAKSEFETLLANSGLSAAEQTAARQARVGKESTTSYEYLTTLDRLGKTTDPTTRAFLKGRLVQLSTHAPGTTVNVDTKVGNKYGETFAKDIGEADTKLRLAALDAPTMAANANQTLKLLEDPKIFTGGAAKVKLNIARALNVIGDTDTTSIANTESLVQSTGNATLAAIKGSGLGTGQGFTDKDLKMLQGVAGGTIELNADTLRAFANAQHNAATAMVKKWESRRANIPTAALSGTGIDKETYSVEPKFSAYVAVKSTADGRKLGKKADGTVEVIK